MPRRASDIYNFVRKRVPVSKVSDENLKFLFAQGPCLGGGPYIWACAALRAHTDRGAFGPSRPVEAAWHRACENDWPLISDWLRATRVTTVHQLSWLEAVQAAQEWHGNQRRVQERREAIQRLRKVAIDPARVCARFNDGAYIYEIVGKDVSDEGMASGHCLRAGASGRHFSLRSRENVPQVSMTFIPGGADSSRAPGWMLQQIQGTWNKVDVKWRPHVFSWLERWVATQGKFEDVSRIPNLLAWFAPLPIEIQHMGKQLDQEALQKSISQVLGALGHLLTPAGLIAVITSMRWLGKQLAEILPEHIPDHYVLFALSSQAAIWKHFPKTSDVHVVGQFLNRSRNEQARPIDPVVLKQVSQAVRSAPFREVRDLLTTAVTVPMASLWGLLRFVPQRDVLAGALRVLETDTTPWLRSQAQLHAWKRLPASIQVRLHAPRTGQGIMRPALQWTYHELAEVPSVAVRWRIMQRLQGILELLETSANSASGSYIEDEAEDTRLHKALLAERQVPEADIETVVDLICSTISYAEDIQRPFKHEEVLAGAFSCAFALMALEVPVTVSGLGLFLPLVRSYTAHAKGKVELPGGSLPVEDLGELLEAVVAGLTTKRELQRLAVLFDEFDADVDQTTVFTVLIIAGMKRRTKAAVLRLFNLESLEEAGEEFMAALATLARFGVHLK